LPLVTLVDDIDSLISSSTDCRELRRLRWEGSQIISDRQTQTDTPSHILHWTTTLVTPRSTSRQPGADGPHVTQTRSKLWREPKLLLLPACYINSKCCITYSYLQTKWCQVFPTGQISIKR